MLSTSIYLSTYLPIYLPTYLSTYLSIYLCIYVSIYRQPTSQLTSHLNANKMSVKMMFFSAGWSVKNTRVFRMLKRPPSGDKVRHPSFSIRLAPQICGKKSLQQFCWEWWNHGQSWCPLPMTIATIVFQPTTSSVPCKKSFWILKIATCFFCANQRVIITKGSMYGIFTYIFLIFN